MCRPARPTIWTLAGALVLAASCGTSNATTLRFAGSEVAPAATGEAEVWPDDNHNYHVQIEVAQLARAPRIEGSPSTYAVWAETSRGRDFLLGHLQVDEDNVARLRTTVPAQRFRIRITAERYRTPAEPSEATVMLTQYVGSS